MTIPFLRKAQDGNETGMCFSFFNRIVLEQAFALLRSRGYIIREEESVAPA